MRDYLKTSEIIDIAEDFLDEEDFESFRLRVESEAETCLCAARSYDDCSCGAWVIEDGICEFGEL